MGRHGLYYAVFHEELVDGEMTRSEIRVEKAGRKHVSRPADKEGADLFQFEAASRGYLIELMEKYTKNIMRV